LRKCPWVPQFSRDRSGTHGHCPQLRHYIWKDIWKETYIYEKTYEKRHIWKDIWKETYIYVTRHSWALSSTEALQTHCSQLRHCARYCAHECHCVTVLRKAFSQSRTVPLSVAVLLCAEIFHIIWKCGTVCMCVCVCEWVCVCVRVALCGWHIRGQYHSATVSWECHWEGTASTHTLRTSFFHIYICLFSYVKRDIYRSLVTYIYVSFHMSFHMSHTLRTSFFHIYICLCMGLFSYLCWSLLTYVTYLKVWWPVTRYTVEGQFEFSFFIFRYVSFDMSKETYICLFWHM